MKRKRTSVLQFQAKAQPRAETRYSTAMARKLSRRPDISLVLAQYGEDAGIAGAAALCESE